MSGTRKVWVVGILGLAALGCARKVVLEPGKVAARNDAAWVVRQAPAPGGSAVAAPAPARAPQGPAPASSVQPLPR